MTTTGKPSSDPPPDPTTTTGKEPSSDPPPPPKPTPSRVVLIDLEATAVGGDFPIAIYSWILFGRRKDDDAVRVCDAKPLLRESADGGTRQGSFPDEDIGPFTAHGIKGCKYKAGGKDKVGTMSCPGVDGIRCRSDAEEELIVCVGGSTIKPTISCQW